MRKKGITDDIRMNLAFPVFIFKFYFTFLYFFIHTFRSPLDIQGIHTETKYVAY